jgi:amidase
MQLDQTFRQRNAPASRETEHYRQALVKRRAARAAVLAAFEEQRLDAVAYPTLRRKPTLIGEAQIGTTCQLSATTGLPAMTMPAGFTADGLPIGVELLGGAFTEARLLGFAYALEQATSPRRPPFSTPALVNGAAPRPTTFAVAVGATGDGAVSTRVTLTYDRTTGILRYDARTTGLTATDGVLALTLQRSDGERPGPVVAHLLAPTQPFGAGMLTLRGRDREAFVAGTLYLHLYTRQVPLGAGRTRLLPP